MKIDVKPSDTGITHLSFSAVRDFLKNPRLFRKRWIDLDFDRTPQLPLIEGSAYHAAVEVYWGMIYAGVHLNPKRGIHIDLDEILMAARRKAEAEYPETADRIKKRIAKADAAEYESMGCVVTSEAKESKTGRKSTIFYAEISIDSIIKGIEKNLIGYMAERDETAFVPLAIEYGAVAQITDAESGELQVFPLKARVDLIVRLPDDRIAIVDHKYMGDDPAQDDDGNMIATPAMILQAAAYESISTEMLKTLNIEGKVTTVIFDIMNKKTGKMSQVIVEIGERERRMWSRVFRGVQQAVLIAYAFGDYDSMFLPNVDDWSDDGWKEFERDIDYTIETGQQIRAFDKPTEDYEPVDL